MTGNGRNKLRTYKLFKSEYGVENYCKVLGLLMTVVLLRNLGAGWPL